MDRGELSRLASVSERLDDIKDTLAALISVDDNEQMEILVTYPESHAKDGETLGAVAMSKVDIVGLLNGLEAAARAELEKAGVSHAA